MNRKKFCAAPFTTLIINADGKVGCCRELGTEHVVGDAFTESIEEIWNGEKIRAWRNEFLSGNINTCAREIEDINCNIAKHNLELLPYVQMNEYVSNPVLRLSPDINGECNLECPMCTVWKKPNGKYNKIENFWADLEKKIIPNLKIMDPLSGEPFIQEDFYRIMEISSRVNPDCQWNFTTNGQWELTDKIKGHLDKIKINHFSVSIDSIDHTTYNKIRRGGDLQQLLRNLDKLKNYCDSRNKKDESIKFIFNFTIQKLNARQLVDMFKFCSDFGADPLMLFLYDPSSLSLESLSEADKTNLLHFYFNNLSKRELILSNRVISPLIRGLSELKKNKILNIYNVLTDGEIKKIKELGEKPFECVSRYIR